MSVNLLGNRTEQHGFSIIYKIMDNKTVSEMLKTIFKF